MGLNNTLHYHVRIFHCGNMVKKQCNSPNTVMASPPSALCFVDHGIMESEHQLNPTKNTRQLELRLIGWNHLLPVLQCLIRHAMSLGNGNGNISRLCTR